jgi:hypothetical protein
MLLTAVFAIFLAWVTFESKQQEKAVAMLEASGAEIAFTDSERYAPRWIKSLLGE